MAEEILFLAPLKSIAQSADRIAREYDVPAKVVYCASNEIAVEWAKNFEAKGGKIIISRGGMALAISKALNRFVFNVGVTLDDFDSAVGKASRFGSIVGVIINSEIEHFFPDISEKYHVNLIKIAVDPGGNFIDAISRAIESDHIDCLVGGVAPSRIAESMSFPYSVIDSSEASIKLALLDAKRTVENKPLEEVTSLSEFMKEFPFGVMTTNLLGKINFCNEYFRKLLDIPTDIIGMPIQSILDGVDLDAIQSSSFPTITMHSMNSVDFYSYAVPVEKGFLFCSQRNEFIKNEILPILDSHMKHGAKASGPKYHFSDIYTDSPTMKDLLWRARVIAKVDSTVLITGESGTGKEMVAQSIHNAGPRVGKPFFAVNCASIADSILESELFGYEEGAFTGARKGGKKGYFELAEGGTLFLDEIGELSPRIQSKLLRAVQEHEIIRVGGERTIPINVRLLVATLEDIPKKISEGSFRPDLYYRINVIHLHLPPLRERLEDIKGLYERIGRKIASRLGVPFFPLKEKWLHHMEEYSWPGNVRELSNVIERLLIQNMAKPFTTESIGQFFLSLQEESRLTKPSGQFEIVSLEDYEMKYIMEVLKRNNGNKAITCKQLGISPTTLWRKLSEEKS